MCACDNQILGWNPGRDHTMVLFQAIHFTDGKTEAIQSSKGTARWSRAQMRARNEDPSPPPSLCSGWVC